jgi:hypothetical protein
MWKRSLLELLFSKMPQNQRWTLCLEMFGISEQERVEHKRLFKPFWEQKHV